MQTSAPFKKNRSLVIILPKLFLILAVVFSMWIVIALTGQMVMEYDSNWTGLSLSFWLILISILFGAFIIIDIIIYAHPTLLTEMNATMQPMTSRTTPFEMKEGKRVYDFTLPKEVKGGLFSKTYIAIDDENVLRIRQQIIPSKTLWDHKEKEDEE